MAKQKTKQTTKQTSTSKSHSKLKRWLPLLLLAAGFVGFFAVDGPSYVSLDALRVHRATLAGWVESLGVFAPVVYGAFYAVVVAFSLPLGTVMSITAGFLFGMLTGTMLVVLGATVGATLLFLAVQIGFGQPDDSKAEKGWMAKMREGFNRNAFSYMIVLRLIPFFPFAGVNIAAALLKVPLPVYFFGTLLGIIPGSFVYVSLGNGLGAIFDSGGTPNLSIIFEPAIIVPIAGLAALVLLQVLYRFMQDRKKARAVAKEGKTADTKPAKELSTKKPAKKRGRPRKNP